jgi:protein tyrosine/serine phosphatase
MPRHLSTQSPGLLLSLALIFLSLALPAAAERGLPAREGILNFGKVDEALYRGAQPDPAGMTNLARLGIRTIINLRMPGDVWTPEETTAKSVGILYTNIPLAGVGRPSDTQIRQALEAIRNAPGPVFVHCQHGCDRTGTVVACYRIEKAGWSSDAALTEAVRYGMSSLERGMKSFVIDFGKSKRTKP